MIQALTFEKPRIETMPAPLDFCLAPAFSSSLVVAVGKVAGGEMKSEEPRCMTIGTIMQRRHEVPMFEPVIARKNSMMYGMVRRVMPPPRLPQPPAVALTVPTIERRRTASTTPGT